jgi:hypothetical protein
MNRLLFLAMAALSMNIAYGQPGAANKPGSATSAPPSTGITIQGMLVDGPPQIRMHSLAMISQGSIKGSIDESYLPGFKACSADASPHIRSITARLLGEHFIKGKNEPNKEAVEILLQLARDKSEDVRYYAVYHGLTQIEDKSEELFIFLLEFASENRNQVLIDRIVESLQNQHDLVVKLLDAKLRDENDIAYFEIYEDFTGDKPPNMAKYLDMPSSLPRLFVIKGTGDDPDADKTELEKELRAVGIQYPDVKISAARKAHVLMVKTYITKEGLAVDKNFSEHPKFKITQNLWLTPELEAQIEAM